MPTVHGILRDGAFRDHTDTIRPAVGTGSPFNPSSQLLSYLKTPYVIYDRRNTREWIGAFDADSKLEILIDQSEASDFVSHADAVPDADINKLMNIIDRCAILLSSGESVSDINTALQGDSDAYGVYTADTLAFSTETRVNATAYNAGSTVVSTPRWISFTVSMDEGDGGVTTDVKLWIDSDTAEDDYPLNAITAVVPLLAYSDLLQGSLTGGGYNLFGAAEIAAEKIRDVVSPELGPNHQTGFYLQEIKLIGSGDVTKSVPFGILHTGQTPDLLEIRTALREDLLNSGTGSEAAWKARAPELFIVNQFYIVPMWDAIAALVDGEIARSSVSVSTLRNRVKTALSQISASHIDDTLESASVSYEAMQTGIVPHPDNLNYDSFTEEHPTYRSYAPSEPGFSTMAPATKTFATKLNDVMAVAAVGADSEIYIPRIDTGVTYYPFVVGTTEYYVMSKESYLDKIG